MKTAYQYLRISQEDQSNFSLSGQEKMNTDYAEKHGIQIIKMFIDDGYSAKNFERPQWKTLEQELSKNKSKIDYLIVTKYDRLIRNAAEGLAFIEKLEQKWNITLLSVMENFFIDPHSPFFFKMRADLLVTAEFERRVISDRSKFGVWAAKNQGRFIGVAPFGYENARDEQNKPIIIVNKEKSIMVEQIYYDFLEDIPPTMIMKKVRESGFNLKGHDAINRVLSNHVYAGLIVTPAYKEEIAKVVKGTHEPIIPEDIFWSAYYKLQDKIRAQGPKIVDPRIPLRGFLLCQSCGNLFTGGKSKGKLAYYYYYRCNKCKGENYNSDKVHNEIAEMLKHLSLKREYLKALQIEAEFQLDESLLSRRIKIDKVTREYNELKLKIDALEEKYINDKIEQVTYTKWHNVYSRDFNGKTIELQGLKKDDSDVRKLYNDYLPYLEDLYFIYKEVDVEGKHTLLKGIFPGCLTKEKQGYGTPLVNSMFLANTPSIGHLLRIKSVGETAFTRKTPTSTRDGT